MEGQKCPSTIHVEKTYLVGKPENYVLSKNISGNQNNFGNKIFDLDKEYNGTDEPTPNDEEMIEEDVPHEILRSLYHLEDKLEPVEEVQSVNLNTEDQPQMVKIGTTLSSEERRVMIELLTQCKDIFAWSYEDMPGLDTDMVVHHLTIIPGMRPVIQKLCKLRPEWSLKVHDEVIKQYEAGFLMVTNYPEWLANIVSVPKKDGKVRMCIDYSYLNKASPKEDFPLPHIDLLVDNAAGPGLLSLMDGFSGYNQIKMAEEDMEKTSFITHWGTFCYVVMPFSLKNAGATYQRAMTTLFHDMMHKDLEVYVDDMIAKYERREDHPSYL